jgi:hypothetical protein
MKIRSDLLQISSGALNVKGEKLEPEEQAVRRETVIEGGAETKHGVGTLGKTVGAIPYSIVSEHSAIEFAEQTMYLCGNCKHFRNDLFLKDLAKAESPAAPIARRRAVNQIRAALLQTAPVTDAVDKDGSTNIEAELRVLGYCGALYEFFQNAGQSKEDSMVLLKPTSHCPADVCTDANPHGFFEPSGTAAKVAQAANYDSVMQQAQGKK